MLENGEPPTSKVFYTAADKIRDTRDGEKKGGGISESFSFQGLKVHWRKGNLKALKELDAESAVQTRPKKDKSEFRNQWKQIRKQTIRSAREVLDSPDDVSYDKAILGLSPYNNTTQGPFIPPRSLWRRRKYWLIPCWCGSTSTLVLSVT
jgi:hypothetical protein